MKIVSDSSCDLYSLEKVKFESVPLHIFVGDKEYIDKEGVDIADMQTRLKEKGVKSSTSCPNVYDYLEAFKGENEIFAITISSNLSGSFQSLKLARDQYLAENKDAKVKIIDSLSAGPVLYMLVEKLQEFILAGLSFEEISKKIDEYHKKTQLLFILSSVLNLANAGRVNKILATILGVLNIKLVGQGSDEGRFQLHEKCRGEKKAIKKLIENITGFGWKNGKVVIDHNDNESGAIAIKEKLLEINPNANVQIRKMNALCAFYAEEHGLLIGIEKE